VGQQVFRQPLEVKIDPRVEIARNQLQSSLALQLRISATLGRNHNAYEQVKDLRARLADLIKRPKDDPIGAAAKALDTKAEGLIGEPTPILATPKTISFMAVNDTFTALLALLDGADAEPSQDSFAAYDRVCKGLNGTLTSWQELESKDLSALNTLLTQNNLEAIPNYPDSAPEASCAK
jgi:hypothetical protein